MRRMTKVIIAVVATLVVVGGGIAVFALQPQEDLSQTVLTEEIQRRDVQVTVAASGSVEAASEIGLSFAAPGVLESLSVDVGDQVTAGTVLAQLKTDSLVASVEAAKSQVAAARAGIDAIALQEAQAQQAINSADLRITSAELSIEVAEEALTNQSLQEDVAYRELAAAEAQRDAALRQMEAIPSQRTQAQAALRSANAQLAAAEASLAQASLVAPMDGTVISIASEVGETVGQAVVGTQATTGFIVLADLSEFVVIADFAEADIVGIQVGQEVEVSFDALPGANTTGIVQEVGLVGSVDPAGGQLTTYDVTISLNSPPEGLRLGMTAQASITTGEQADVVAAPVTALLSDGDQTYVNVLREDGTIERVDVTLGIQGGYWVEVTSGLTGGEKVVTGSSGDIPVVGGGGFGGPPEGTPGNDG